MLTVFDGVWRWQGMGVRVSRYRFVGNVGS